MSFFNFFQSKKKSKHIEVNLEPVDKSMYQAELLEDLKSNIETINKLVGFASDISVREFTIGGNIEIKAAVIMINGLTDIDLINEKIIGTLMTNDKFCNITSNIEFFETLKIYGIPSTYVKEEIDSEKIIAELINGNTILFIDKISRALIIGSQGGKERAVSEPITENVVRGPRDGFTETISTNTALIRRRIKSPDLRIETFEIGAKTKTKVSIVYLEGTAKETVIKEVKERLGRIKIDSILESGYIEELIEDNPMSPFPQIEHSERPDKVAAAILGGRVAILVDTTPFTLMVPTIFFQFVQSADDYYERFPIGSLTRVVRIVALFISAILPALYIALTSFHQEMIPTTLALSIAASREGVPLPSIGEAFIMEGIFEILREAGLRLPKQAGQAVSIVGGIVIGEAAVQAGIISQAMIIIVALTGISSFAIPAFNAAAAGRLIRFPLMLIASVLGLPGILAGLSIIIIHMNSLRSFGVNYMDPFISANQNEFKDIIIRSPWWRMTRLPGYIARGWYKRMPSDMKPGPKGSSEKNKNNK